jgi:S-DNA-T family DNA segregation ATPase FtsK/SpoIIIE
MILLGIQNPDAKSIPLGIVRLMGTRFCLRVDGQPANDMVLGTSSYQLGHRATLFSEEDKGVGLLKAGSSVRTVRTYYMTADQLVDIGRRALALRTMAGTVTGDAAGQDIPDDIRDRTRIVVDLVNVWTRLDHPHADAPGTDGLKEGPSAWLASLADALAEAMPGRYDGMDGDELGARLRGLDVPTMTNRKRNVDGGQVNRAGVALGELERVLTAEDAPTG